MFRGAGTILPVHVAKTQFSRGAIFNIKNLNM
jgi:hypothetical protein